MMITYNLRRISFGNFTQILLINPFEKLRFSFALSHFRSYGRRYQESKKSHVHLENISMRIFGIFTSKKKENILVTLMLIPRYTERIPSTLNDQYNNKQVEISSSKILFSLMRNTNKFYQD